MTLPLVAQVATRSLWCEDLRVPKTSPPTGLFAMQSVHPAIAVLVVGIVVALGWLPYLTNSFLLDETLTAWVVADGFTEAFDRTVQYQPQPAYNLFMWCWAQLVGTSEVALRIPSLLAALAACIAITRLGTRLTQDRELGLLSAVVFATSWNVYRESIDARSYMLGMIVLLCLVLCLLRWMEDGRWQDAVWCGVLAALLPHLHFFFVLSYPAFFVFAWLRRSEARWDRGQFILAGGIVIFGALLYIPTAQMLFAQGGAYSFVARPDWRSLFEVFVWTAPVAGLLAGLAVAGLFAAGDDESDPRDENVGLTRIPVRVRFSSELGCCFH